MGIKRSIDLRHRDASLNSRLVSVAGSINVEKSASELASALNQFFSTTGYKIRAVAHCLDDECYVELRPTISDMFDSAEDFAMLTDTALAEIVSGFRQDGTTSKGKTELRRIERALGNASTDTEFPLKLFHGDRALVGVKKKLPSATTIRSGRRPDSGFRIIGFDARRNQVLLQAKRGAIFASLDRKEQGQAEWEYLQDRFIPPADFHIDAEFTDDGSYVINAASLLCALREAKQR